MIYGSERKKKTGEGKGFLSFNSGKKVVLTSSEKKEFENWVRLRMAEKHFKISQK